MKTPAKIAIIGVLALAVIGAVALKRSNTPSGSAPSEQPATVTMPEKKPDGKPADAAVAKAKIPRLVDLGATKCIPCKMMAPILEELKKEYAGRMEVEFIDVWEKPEAAKPYGIEKIPTQILYDTNGKELFRHEGFFGKEDILAKWKELGVDLGGQK